MHASAAACSPRTLSGRGQFFGVMTKVCLLMLDLIFSVGSIGFPLRSFLRRMRDGSAQGQGAAQYVGRQVEVVCNAFGCDASFSDFDLRHPGKPDPWRLAPELKFLMRPQLHWALQEEGKLAPTDRPVQESLSCKRSKYLCSDRPSKLPTNGSLNR